MQNKKEYSVHIACAAAMLLLSGSIIVMPQEGADQNTFLGFVAAAVAAVLLSAAVLPLVLRLFSFKPSGGVSRAAVSAVYVLTGIFAVAVAAFGFSTFTDFVGDLILPSAARLLIAAVFFAAAILPSAGDKGIILKFSLFAFFITAAVVVFFLAASASGLQIVNIKLMRAPKIMSVVKQGMPYFFRMLAPLIIIYIYVGMFFGKEKKRSALSGTVMGCVLLGVCILNVLLLFGAPLAAKLDYPYAAAISTVTLGELFTRMDGFSYFIYFAAQMIQIVMCVSVIRELICRLGEKRKKKIAVFFLAIILAVGCIL